MNFKTFEVLNHHQKSHPKCELCNKRFKTVKERDNHYNSHPKCELCGTVFTNDKNLRKHIKKVHPNSNS